MRSMRISRRAPVHGARWWVIALLAAERTFEGTRSGRVATLVLREHDYVNQANAAAKEIMHVDAQIVAAEIRAQVAERELSSHRLRMDQARAEVDGAR